MVFLFSWVIVSLIIKFIMKNCYLYGKKCFMLCYKLLLMYGYMVLGLSGDYGLI